MDMEKLLLFVPNKRNYLTHFVIEVQKPDELLSVQIDVFFSSSVE